MTADQLDTVFAALADPTRRAILARLASGAATVTELAEPFEMSLPGISKHLKVLRRAGLIEQGRDAQWRPCQLDASPLKEVADWVEPYRRFWEQSFDRLDDYLQVLKNRRRDVLDRNSAALALTFPSDREIVMTRVFDAPRQLVFEAWTKPEHLVHWFGARGWSLTICEIELRPGGTYRFVWRGPEGEEMGMGGVYREILPPERLVSTESFVGCVPGKESVNTMILEERNGKTTMTTTIVYPSAEVRDAVIQSGMERGVGESMDRLAEHLQTMA